LNRSSASPSGKTNVTGPSGEAELAISISGRKGKGTIYVIATKSAGEWQYSKLIVKTDNGETIDLNQNTEPNGSETNDEPDDNETQADRARSTRLGRGYGAAGICNWRAVRKCGTRRLVNSTESPAERCDHSGQLKVASSGKSSK
jgi:hypothetical protein